MVDEVLAESDTHTTEKGDTPDLTEVHERAMQRFDTVAPVQVEMRAQSLEDRRFVTIEGAMWESGWAEQWPENAPRPEIDKITKSLEKIITDYRENRMVTDFIPTEDDGKDTAEAVNGMYLADFAHFKCQQSRDNAFQEAIMGGMGAWRLTTDYTDPYDPDDDSLRVNPGMTIVDADQSVFFDGAAVQMDKSDAKWAFVLSAMTRASFDEAWDEANAVDWPLSKWDWQWDWYTPDVVYVAEYYEIEDTTDKLLIFTQDQSGEEQRYFASEIDDGVSADLKAQGWSRSTRSIRRRRVHKYVMNGSQVLKDCGYIPGPNIPIVPVYGRRDYVDNMERWRGHVRKRKDMQRAYNTQYGRLIEIASISPFQVDEYAEGQIDTTQAEQHARANIERLPYLTSHPILNPDGTVAHLGPVGKKMPPEVPAVTATILQAANADLSDSNDPAEQVKANVSADAMDIAADRVDSKSFMYLDNYRQAEQRAGEIWLGMGREVYYEPDRRVDTMTAEGKQGTVVLKQLTRDPNGVYRIRNDLTQGKMRVIADVQEATATKRQKTVRQALGLSSAFAAANATDEAVGSLYLAAMNMDGDRIDDFQDRIRQKAIAAGWVKPTPEEQEQINAAQQGQQPSPQEIALGAAAKESESKAALNQASAVEKVASAELKRAQAEAVGGPEQAPDVPSGLSPVETVDKLAGADLKTAQAAKIRHDIGHQRIRLGREILAEDRDHALATRAQDHAESQSKEAA